MIQVSAQGLTLDPYDLGGIGEVAKDMRVLKCRIRGSIEEGRFSRAVNWLPSRVESRVRRLSVVALQRLAQGEGGRAIRLGVTLHGEPLRIRAEDLDGRLNVITGRKGSGKSHLAKLLVQGLVNHGAYVLVFDINGEYLGLDRQVSGDLSALKGRFLPLTPGLNLKFTLQYIGLPTLTDVLRYVYGIPEASLREFTRLWELVEKQYGLSFSALGEAIAHWRGNEYVREALLSRYYQLARSRLFTDAPGDSLRLEEIVDGFPDGALIVVDLSRVEPLTRRLVVELLLAKLVELLEQGDLPPIFLFAEEAHLYLRETYWEDVVTRMRHFGLFTTFITNQPSSIKHDIYRQVDNIFLFSFTNHRDLEAIADIAPIDRETVKSTASTLPPGTCLLIGEVVSQLPVVARVDELRVEARGETRRFFPLLEAR